MISRFNSLICAAPNACLAALCALLRPIIFAATSIIFLLSATSFSDYVDRKSLPGIKAWIFLPAFILDLIFSASVRAAEEGRFLPPGHKPSLNDSKYFSMADLDVAELIPSRTFLSKRVVRKGRGMTRECAYLSIVLPSNCCMTMTSACFLSQSPFFRPNTSTRKSAIGVVNPVSSTIA